MDTSEAYAPPDPGVRRRDRLSSELESRERVQRCYRTPARRSFAQLELRMQLSLDNGSPPSVCGFDMDYLLRPENNGARARRAIASRLYNPGTRSA